MNDRVINQADEFALLQQFVAREQRVSANYNWISVRLNTGAAAMQQVLDRDENRIALIIQPIGFAARIAFLPSTYIVSSPTIAIESAAFEAQLNEPLFFSTAPTNALTVLTGIGNIIATVNVFFATRQ